MRCLLPKKFVVQALELFFHALDLPVRRGTLLFIELRGFRASQPPVSALQNRRCHLQLARHRCLVPLRLEEQRRIVQDAFPDCGRPAPPGSIQLSS